MRNAVALLIITLLLSLNLVSAQTIWNSGFETWIAMPPEGEHPEGWSTSNSSILGGDSAVSKSLDAYSGFYAAELRTLNLGFAGLPYAASLVLGTTNGGLLSQGIPMNILPVAISGYYKYVSNDSLDSAHVIVILKKYNVLTSQRDTIGLAVVKLGFSLNYTKFTIEIDELLSGIAPDSIVIAFYSSDPENAWNNMYFGGQLLIDELSLDTVVGMEDRLGHSLSVHPNPTTSRILLGNLPAESSDVFIYDVLGQMVLSVELEGNLEQGIDLSCLSSGSYMINLFSGNTVFRKKVLKL